MSIRGTFLESPTDSHVSLRATFLERWALPSPLIKPHRINADTLLSNGLAAVERDLERSGVGIIQMDHPLNDLDFIAFGYELGTPIPEKDPAVQPFVTEHVVLNLRTISDKTEDVSIQPFAANFLTLHSESSGRRWTEQPRYVVLMCADPGDDESAAQTVIVPNGSIIDQLSFDACAILAETFYDNDTGSPAILRLENGRRIISFRDFHQRELHWIHDGPANANQVREALLDLLAAMYSGNDAYAIRWSTNLLAIIDNHTVMHARSTSVYDPTKSSRFLKRLRVRTSDSDNSVALLADTSSLFGHPSPRRPIYILPAVREQAKHLTDDPHTVTIPFVDDQVLDLFSRAKHPDDPMELRDLWIGRVEAELGDDATRPELAARWREARVMRTVSEDEVLSSRTTVRFIKELFNTYFRDDLYGRLRGQAKSILSGGALDETVFGLPTALKQTIQYALVKDLYGYSDSRGREPAREAVAEYESTRLGVAAYSADSVALTMGATFAVANLADFLLTQCSSWRPALCGIPNYPPLVQSIAKRHDVQLVPMDCSDGHSSLANMKAALSPDTPLVLLQTAANPTGIAVKEDELADLIESASSSTLILLDECHEWLGAEPRLSPARARANVIRVFSLSKRWSAPGIKAGWFLADPAIVSEYYEHASTTFGGPPSFFYTLIEVLARMERWRLEGLEHVGPAQIAEFEPEYRLTEQGLNSAFSSYLAERKAFDESLLLLRDATVVRLRQIGADVVWPQRSINAAALFPEFDDSYLCFRRLLHDTGVAVYPGVLNFYLAGGWFRITYARKWDEITNAMGRLERRLVVQKS
ncbi:aminotransferase class I/II-fold pyridoxal phosphate-dependent enzyme [Nostoc sp. 'Peltigera membranacea cyanobiont' 210A]|uniref:aminotransferase class I/II-fold pyridoxal phosphate-dependent enzyme n=1 Tax=Nostoc sp. 'Peltigera membranacea cyanobiont' 210A TaxID=2014529 RepID=UPI00167C641C|nr:aminotransferase class I/II-fold pyridoxal phosphate-dependent enzyme [Nostoc sp. 'Peltigera membranacea cyanobiont' 210A]